MYNHKVLKNTFFILFSTQMLYILFHLQFLLGMPQAGLSLQDALFFLLLGITLFILSKNFVQYFLGMAIVLWPTVQLQYFYIKIFNKPFTFQDMLQFPTLIQVSPLLTKICYITSFILWCSGGLYFLVVAFKKWYKYPTILKIIPLCTGFLCVYLFFIPVNQEKYFWVGDTSKDIFFFRGILAIFQIHKDSDTHEILSESIVKQSYDFLIKNQKKRDFYPIKDSPEHIPHKKIPIFIIILESFYDFQHFISLFDEDPFPKEYRNMVNSERYSGPNQSYGSFDARFVTLTGSSLLKPSRNRNIPYSTLANILSDYGYTTIAVEAVNSTYNLQDYYKIWGFEDAYFELYGRDWHGKVTSPDTYEKKFSDMIKKIPKEDTPFCLGFTYLGHSGSLFFTNKLPDSENIENFLNFFDHTKTKNDMKQLIKAAIFNAERVVNFKKMILEKYPDALIVIKADHYSPELYQIISGDNKIPEEYKNKFYNDPMPLPFFVMKGGRMVDLRRGFSPGNIPLMILAEAGLPYKNTIPSLLFRNTPKDFYSLYGKLYKYDKLSNTYSLLDEKNEEYTELFDQEKAIGIISRDLYRSKEQSKIFDWLVKE